MKKIMIFMLFVLATANVFSQNTGPEETDLKLQKAYSEFLRAEGFSPSVDEDGDVKFKYQGDIYYLCPDGYAKRFKILRQLTNDSADEFVALLQSANNTMREYFSVKIVVNTSESGCNVNFYTQSLLAGEDDFRKIFYKCLDIIQESVIYYRKDYEE